MAKAQRALGYDVDQGIPAALVVGLGVIVDRTVAAVDVGIVPQEVEDAHLLVVDGAVVGARHAAHVIHADPGIGQYIRGIHHVGVLCGLLGSRDTGGLEIGHVDVTRVHVVEPEIEVAGIGDRHAAVGQSRRAFPGVVHGDGVPLPLHLGQSHFLAAVVLSIDRDHRTAVLHPKHPLGLEVHALFLDGHIGSLRPLTRADTDLFFPQGDPDSPLARGITAGVGEAQTDVECEPGCALVLARDVHLGFIGGRASQAVIESQGTDRRLTQGHPCPLYVGLAETEGRVTRGEGIGHGLGGGAAAPRNRTRHREVGQVRALGSYVVLPDHGRSGFGIRLTGGVLGGSTARSLSLGGRVGVDGVTAPLTGCKTAREGGDHQQKSNDSEK